MRILIVEDDSVIANVMSVMLKRFGFEVGTAADGLAGVRMWEQGGFDLILMDVQMPRLNGFEATVRIRERERENGGHTPIIALTAHVLDKDEEECLAMGMDAFISKPVDFKKCIEMIRNFETQPDVGSYHKPA